MPLLSILLPNYNHAAFLPERLESIQKQSFTDWELLIYDDGSTDSSHEILKAFKDSRIAILQLNAKNSGSPFGLWKEGLNQTKGKYIWIAESDDSCEPYFLEKLVGLLERDSDLELAYAASSWIDQSGAVIHKPEHESETLNLDVHVFKKDFLLKGTTIYNVSSAVFRKSNIENLDFDRLKSFKYVGDWFFWWSILKNGKVCRLNERLNKFRRHASNVSFQAESQGIHFKEGLPLVRQFLKEQKVGFFAELKVWLFWSSKVHASKKHQYISLFPWMVRMLYPLMSFLAKK